MSLTSFMSAFVGRRRAVAALGSVALIALGASAVLAQDIVKVGKTASNALAFTPPEIGTAKGIWEKHGLKVEVQQYPGDARMQQGMIANEIDLGLGSGPSMGFIAKKAPIMTVGVIANQPLSMGLIVGKDSKYKKPEDLKGARIGITTNGSLTYWLVRELSRRMGWGPGGLRPVALGSITGQIAGLKSGQVDGFIMSASVGYMLDQKNEGEVMLLFGDMINDFHTHVVFASNRMIETRPDVLRRFLAGWIETVAYMRANPDDVERHALQRRGPQGHCGVFRRAWHPRHQARSEDALHGRVPATERVIRSDYGCSTDVGSLG
jgi:ABC-type nitrate/sulfonate/bicarbonate transport system substrate-binding protein